MLAKGWPLYAYSCCRRYPKCYWAIESPDPAEPISSSANALAITTYSDGGLRIDVLSILDAALATLSNIDDIRDFFQGPPRILNRGLAPGSWY